jgi:hypothetical protein
MECERSNKSTVVFPSQCVNLSSQVHAAAYLPPEIIGQTDLWAPVPVCIICRRKNFLLAASIRTAKPIVQSSHTTDFKHLVPKHL